MVVKECEIRYKSSEKITAAAATLDRPERAFQFLRDKIGDQTKEHFITLMMNNKNRVIGWETVSIGTISKTLIHPREVFRLAIWHGAAAIIVAHNHPTGELTASKEDIATTKRLNNAANIIGIPILDHLIITEEKFLSLKEQGYL